MGIWACNVAAALTPGAPCLGGDCQPCGTTVCASGESNAKQQAAALAGVSATDSDLTCTLCGTNPLQLNAIINNEVTAGNAFNAPGAVCIGGTCNPCSDGQGGTLQSVGEPCAAPAEYAMRGCCAGLVCQDPNTGQPLMAGTSSMGVCAGTLQSCPQPQPNWVGLDTATLRNICLNNNVNGSASQSGITLNRTCGVAFETWVLKTMGWLPRWTKLIPSPERKQENKSKGGLPASVIPEQVLDQPAFMTWAQFPQSVFVEVKAVNGTLTLGTSQYQILGLVDGVNTWPPVPDAGTHAPPAVFFITTSNTAISKSPMQVVTTATGWNVAVWQQFVYYDANGGTNPNLSVGDPTNPKATCLDDSVYGAYATQYQLLQSWGGQNPLTWATDQEQDVVGAVPEPAPDSPAVVP
jgi:hypothetical protein